MNLILGKFDMDCKLFAPTVNTDNASGEVILEYSEIPTETIFCYVNSRANNEVFNDMQRQSNTTQTIDCMYNDILELGVDSTWLMQVEGQTYQITSVVDAVEYERRTVTRLSGIERIG